MEKILLPNFIKEENPITAEFCEIINEALKNRPNMSLAEFAERLNEVHKERALKWLKNAVDGQFAKDEGEYSWR